MALYSPGKNANIVISRLIYNFLKISEWFSEKYVVPNADKCLFLTLGFKEPFLTVLQLKMLPRKRLLGQ